MIDALAQAPLFVRPLFDQWHHWYLLLIPLSAGFAIVYKSIKCADMRRVPREATIVFLWVVLGMIAAQVALLLLVKLAYAIGW